MIENLVGFFARENLALVSLSFLALSSIIEMSGSNNLAAHSSSEATTSFQFSFGLKKDSSETTYFLSLFTGDMLMFDEVGAFCATLVETPQ